MYLSNFRPIGEQTEREDDRNMKTHSTLGPTAVVHSIAEIEALLRRGRSPVTDNREALSALGFHRAYPQLDGGYDSTVWERSIDSGRAPGERRALARQRAYLETKAH